MIRKTILLLALTFFALRIFSQTRAANKLTVEKSYFITEIKKPLRDYIESFDKSSFFKDDFSG